MSRFSPFLLLALAGLAGCASSPKAPSALAMTDCTQLRAEIARAEDDKRAALDKKENAWKAVIPFAIAAQYGVGLRAADAADKRLGELGSQSQRHGCAS